MGNKSGKSVNISVLPEQDEYLDTSAVDIHIVTHVAAPQVTSKTRVSPQAEGTEDNKDELDIEFLKTYRNEDGDSGIHLVCYMGYAELLSVLLASHAAPNLRNNAGNTGLHISAYNGNLEIAEILLHNGANADSLNYARETPLMIAREKGHSALISLLAAHGSMGDEMLEDWLVSEPEMSPADVMYRFKHPSYSRRRDFLMFLAQYHFLKPLQRYPRESAVEIVFATKDLHRYIMSFL